MRESFESSLDSEEDLQKAMRQKQGEDLLGKSKLIEEYKEAELSEPNVTERTGYGRGSRGRGGYIEILSLS